ncbi:MAG: septum formation initiator family protein [Eubacteriales bacterium]
MATIQSRRIPKRKVKAKKKKKFKISTQFKYFSYLLIAFILGLTIIYNYAIITQTRMEIDDINKEINTLSKEKEDMLVLIESAKNTGIIEENAKNFLGMDYPDLNQRTFVEVAYSKKLKEVAMENTDHIALDNIFRKTFSLIKDY